MANCEIRGGANSISFHDQATIAILQKFFIICL
jgi:hypothetical protein